MTYARCTNQNVTTINDPNPELMENQLHFVNPGQATSFIVDCDPFEVGGDLGSVGGVSGEIELVIPERFLDPGDLVLISGLSVLFLAACWKVRLISQALFNTGTREG